LRFTRYIYGARNSVAVLILRKFPNLLRSTISSRHRGAYGSVVPRTIRGRRIWKGSRFGTIYTFSFFNVRASKRLYRFQTIVNFNIYRRRAKCRLRVSRKRVNRELISTLTFSYNSVAAGEQRTRTFYIERYNKNVPLAVSRGQRSRPAVFRTVERRAIIFRNISRQSPLDNGGFRIRVFGRDPEITDRARWKDRRRFSFISPRLFVDFGAPTYTRTRVAKSSRSTTTSRGRRLGTSFIENYVGTVDLLDCTDLATLVRAAFGSCRPFAGTRKRLVTGLRVNVSRYVAATLAVSDG